MRKAFFSALAFTAAVAASAFDNTVVDDFWDTTGYVNGTVSRKTATLAAPLDTRLKVTRAAVSQTEFQATKGLFIIFR